MRDHHAQGAPLAKKKTTPAELLQFYFPDTGAERSEVDIMIASGPFTTVDDLRCVLRPRGCWARAGAGCLGDSSDDGFSRASCLFAFLICRGHLPAATRLLTTFWLRCRSKGPTLWWFWVPLWRRLTP